MKNVWNRMGNLVGAIGLALLITSPRAGGETIVEKNGWSSDITRTTTADGGGTISAKFFDPSGKPAGGVDVRVAVDRSGSPVTRWNYSDGTWLEYTVSGGFEGPVQVVYRSSDGQKATQSFGVNENGEFVVTTRNEKTGETWVTTGRKNTETGKIEPVTIHTVQPSSRKGSSKGENGPTAGPMPSAGVSPGLTQELQRDKLR